jgi:hypothetical protein
MVAITNDEWIVDIARKQCHKLGMSFTVEIDYDNYCLTGTITRIPKTLRKLNISHEERELYFQLIIREAINIYLEALRKKNAEFYPPLDEEVDDDE